MATSDSILKSMDRMHDKIDAQGQKIHKIDLKTTTIKGEVKAMNGQISRNKEDIKSMKKYVAKLAAGIGTFFGAVVAFIGNLIR